MKKNSINNMPIDPIDYGVSFTPRFDDIDMSDKERLFVSGLIKFYRPSNILEIGVAGGGGTVNILETIKDMETELISIDACEIFNHPYAGKTIRVGDFVVKHYGDTSFNNQWRLITGKEPSEVMDDLNEMFDFVIIDTAHYHPVESFNFLTVLPYLKDGAIVILHDISLFLEPKAKECFAPCILFSVITGNKLIPDTKSISDAHITNIGAFQIDKNTRKYIRNVFDALMLPWADVWQYVLPWCRYICRHYGEELQGNMWNAVKANIQICIIRGKLPNVLIDILSQKSIVFYGAGENMRKYISMIGNRNDLDFEIWDKSARTIKSILGEKVYFPKSIKEKYEKDMIVTVSNEGVYEEIRSQYCKSGFTFFHGLAEYLSLQLKNICERY